MPKRQTSGRYYCYFAYDHTCEETRLITKSRLLHMHIKWTHRSCAQEDTRPNRPSDGWISDGESVVY